MPWSAKQERVWQAIAHGWKPDKGSLSHISQEKAKKMAAEGVKGKDADTEARRRALRE